jgi:cysteine synthase A
MARKFARSEGVLAGISAGAALYAGVKTGLREEYQDKNIVVLLPDTGERYLSTGLFDFE